MKKLLITLATVAALTGAAHAEDMAGKKLAAGSTGQPFCLELADLKEFLTAALTEDNVWLRAILKEDKCTMLKSGTALAVLEDLPADHDEIHPIKIRAIGSKGSIVGYSLNVGIVARR